MLAKVVKKHAAENFTSFSIPEIGADQSSFENNANFAFPNLENLEPVEEIAEIIQEEVFSETTEDDILQNAREEAARILAQAEKDKETIEFAAREKGLQFAQNSIDTEVSAQVNQMRTEFTETIEKIAGLQAEITAGAEIQLVELALEIAKKLVLREISIDREIALTLVKVSLKRLNSRATAKVLLNPDDFAFVGSHREKLDFHGSLEIIEDRSISVGGCLIQTETGDIDARIESQFDEISHGLLGV
jgi:flagellar assembly protein FliH